MVKWYSLFSHTGSETAAVCDALGGVVQLKAALTTNKDYVGPLNPIRLTGQQINEWLTTPGNVEDGSVITLNGYMRILPEFVLDYLRRHNCMVLNIHPALINRYPELRGADPQERTYYGIQAGIYKQVGVVIHHVDAGVDTGDILSWSMQIADTTMSKSELYALLHGMGAELWLDVFKEIADGQNN